MKRMISMLLAAAMLLSLAACAAPAAETAAPSQAAMPAASEAATPSPTAQPTPTPEPTMSPEEIETLEYYEELKSYWVNDEDFDAANLILYMFYAGEIPEEKLAIFNPGEKGYGWQNIDDNFFYARQQSNYTSKILNGKFETTAENAYYLIDEVYKHIQGWADSGRAAYIYLLENKKERKAVTQAIELCKKWFQDPSDENRRKMEDAYFSEDIEHAGIMILFTWFNMTGINQNTDNVKVDGKKYNFRGYITLKLERFGKSIRERFHECFDPMEKQNSTPNSQKSGLSFPAVPMVLTEMELENISKLSDADELKYYREHFNDEHAALQLKKMHDGGTLADGEYSGDLAEFAERCPAYKKERYQNAADMLNARPNMSVSDLNSGRISLDAFFWAERIPISLFDSREARMKVLQGVNLVHRWLQDPIKENTADFEAFINTGELTKEEYIFIYKYAKYYETAHQFNHNNRIIAGGKKYNSNYFDERIQKNGMSMEEMYAKYIGLIKIKEPNGYSYDLPGLYD